MHLRLLRSDNERHMKEHFVSFRERKNEQNHFTTRVQVLYLSKTPLSHSRKNWTLDHKNFDTHSWLQSYGYKVVKAGDVKKVKINVRKNVYIFRISGERNISHL